MTQGRKPKPTEERRRAGNPGKRPLNENEPAPPAGAPECPPELEGLAVQAWDWLCTTLDAMGLLVKSDVAIMSLYCDAWANFWEARREVEEEGLVLSGGKGGSYINPAYNVKASCANRLAKYITELGLSATSRTRLHAPPKPKDDGKSKFFKVVG